MSDTTSAVTGISDIPPGLGLGPDRQPGPGRGPPVPRAGPAVLRAGESRARPAQRASVPAMIISSLRAFKASESGESARDSDIRPRRLARCAPARGPGVRVRAGPEHRRGRRGPFRPHASGPRARAALLTRTRPRRAPSPPTALASARLAPGGLGVRHAAAARAAGPARPQSAPAASPSLRIRWTGRARAAIGGEGGSQSHQRPNAYKESEMPPICFEVLDRMSAHGDAERVPRPFRPALPVVCAVRCYGCTNPS